MWKRFFEVMRQVILLTDKTERNANDIAKLQESMKDLTLALEQLRYELYSVRDKNEHERSMIQLRLENQLLKFERRLKPGEESDDS